MAVYNTIEEMQTAKAFLVGDLVSVSPFGGAVGLYLKVLEEPSEGNANSYVFRGATKEEIEKWH